MDETSIFIGASTNDTSKRQELELKRANRHGLIAGATGTGKTVTLQGMIEGFSAVGTPCFVADVKGDLSGLAMAGSPQSKTHESFAARAQQIGDTDWHYADTPVQFWDLFGEQGHPIRTTVSEMGPLLLARLMGLNDVQEGVLTIAFTVADKDGMLLLDLDDLQAMLADCANRASELTTTYGNVSKQSIGSIQRNLLQLRSQGGDHFFGEPALELRDFLKTDDSGRGVVNILAADKLMQSPQLYSTFLLWLMSELFETMPEVGDPDKPVLCFFFDEAHLLFDDIPKALEDKIEQVVRLIRSKGIGIYFITQNPIDIPETVAGQLNNRVQHKLNAYTPRDQQAVRAAATTFRANPGVDVATVITELAVGEALVSLLQPDGSPEPVERTLIRPPSSRVGPIAPDERRTMIETDAIGTKYDTPVNRESAFEMLKARADQAAQEAAQAPPPPTGRTAAQGSTWGKVATSAATSAARSASSAIARQVANEIGREIFGRPARRSSSSSGGGGLVGGLVRGVLGSLFRGR